MEFLTRSRLENAARLLEEEPAMSVTEIAFRSGFQSSQYFSQVFRSHHGHTPSEHRKRALHS
jgi:AraC family transcriptional regulator, 4-hydroxyphenylacetate 3-monooxygenase operon regulatory protein